MKQFEPIEVTQTEFDAIVSTVNIFITGTAAYGPFTKNSDIDIVVMQKTGNVIEFLLNAIGIETKPINDEYEEPSFFFHVKGLGRTIQVVTINIPYQFVGWYKATQKLKTIEPILERGDRVGTFQRLSKISLVPNEEINMEDME